MTDLMHKPVVDPDAPLFVLAAAQYRHKNIATAVEAFSRVHAHEPRARLVLVGQVPALMGETRVGAALPEVPGVVQLGFVSDVLARAGYYETGATGVSRETDRRLGSSRMLFGTDHPFFPPLSDTEKWKSVVENLEAIEGVQGWGQEEKDGVCGGNAVSLLGL